MKLLPMTVVCDEVWPFYEIIEEGTFPTNCQIPESLYEEYKKTVDDFNRFQKILKEYYQNAEGYQNDD